LIFIIIKEIDGKFFLTDIDIGIIKILKKL